jgi:integrase
MGHKTLWDLGHNGGYWGRNQSRANAHLNTDGQPVATDFYDDRRYDGVRGLFLRVSANEAERTYYLRYRFDGVKRTMKIGSASVLTAAKAREIASAKLLLALQGIDPNAAHLMPTLGEIGRDYIEKHAKVHNRDWEREEKHFRCELAVWHNIKADAIKKSALAALLGGIVSGKTSLSGEPAPSVAIQTLDLIRAIYRFWLGQTDFNVKNPALGFIIPGIKRRTPEELELIGARPLTDDEIVAIWHTIEAKRDVREHELPREMREAFIKLLLFTGCRAREALQARFDEFDLERAVWTLPPNRNKTKNRFEGPLSSSTIDVIEKLKRLYGGEYLFPMRRRIGKPMTAFQGWIDQVKDECKLGDKFSAHSFRKTVVTGIVRNGLGEDLALRATNHKVSSRIASIYSKHDWMPEKRRALDAWAAHVVALLEKADWLAAKAA